jgi:hypothetical protein
MRTRIAIATALVIALTSIQSPIATSATRPKAAGRTTASVANTILNGKGAPASTKGIDGDFYIDTKNLTLYGPKTNGRWSSPQSLQGPQGDSGVDGKNGSDGKAATLSSSGGSAGPAGPQGETGATGPAGPQGPAGPSGGGGGSPGPAGADGAQGPAGPKGETGTAGSIGPSLTRVTTIPSFSIASSTGFTSNTSSYFETLTAGYSYKFSMIIKGTVAAILDEPFGLEVITSNGPTLVYDYSLAEHEYVTGISTRAYKYSFVVEGILVAGISDSQIAVKITEGGAGTDGVPITFTGKAFFTRVGEVIIVN